MKKNILINTVISLMIIIAIFNLTFVFSDNQSYNITMSNIEAMANNEGDPIGHSESQVCPDGISYAYRCVAGSGSYSYQCRKV